MVQSHVKSGCSAATQVKAVSPDFFYSQWAMGWFALKPLSLQALEGESATTCRIKQLENLSDGCTLTDCTIAS